MNPIRSQDSQLDHLARVLVAQTFFGPMLKQMRNSPFKADWVDGGRGGQVFQGQLDQKLAERMASAGSGDRLVKSIVKRIEKLHRNHVPTPDRT
jgi:Rod binding domain-containing protein